MKGYPITPIFEVGMSEYDTSIVYMPFSEAQLYFNMDGRAQTIEIYVDNPDDVDALKPKVEAAAQRQIDLTDWRQRNETFFSALQVERNVMFMILTLIVLVAALNIISGLIMLVKDKGHDIAILRTMGATRGAILRIFLMTGAAIGVTGTLAGVLLGVLICINIESIRQFFSWMTGTVLFNPELYFLSQLPAKMDAARDDLCHPDGAGAVLPGNGVSGMAGRPARSGRSPEVRVMAEAFIELKSVERHYVQGPRKLTILNGADFALKRGEMVALVAPSGTGKSTLLHTAGLLERPDAGDVILAGRACGRLSDDERTAIRRNDVGFVYQFHHLLPEFSALENIMMPQLIKGLSRKEARARGATARLHADRQARIAPALRAFRRRAAARRHCPCGRQCAAGAAGR